MIKIFFTYQGETMTLPVNPAKLEITREGGNATAEIVKLGEINLLRTPKLAEISFEGIFPYDNSAFSTTSEKCLLPQQYIDFFERARTDCKPMEMSISDTEIQLSAEAKPKVSIESFGYYREGGDMDVHYTLKLKEYKAFSARIGVIEPSSTTVTAKPTAREEAKSTPKTYTVKKGDTLWAISKKYLGDGSKYPTIAKLNNIANPNKIQIGQVLKLS